MRAMAFARTLVRGSEANAAAGCRMRTVPLLAVLAVLSPSIPRTLSKEARRIADKPELGGFFNRQHPDALPVAHSNAEFAHKVHRVHTTHAPPMGVGAAAKGPEGGGRHLRSASEIRQEFSVAKHRRSTNARARCNVKGCHERDLCLGDVVVTLSSNQKCHPDNAWLREHEAQSLEAKLPGGLKQQILLVGDSITQHLRAGQRNSAVLQGTYAQALPASERAQASVGAYAISGDTTQQLLWRLLNGGLPPTSAERLDCEPDVRVSICTAAWSPRVVSLLIGTNNLGIGAPINDPEQTVEDTIAGVAAVVAELR